MPITRKNSPGFAVNRILCPMINEAIFALQEGIATAEEIDAGMKLGCNHPIGPLALADMIGLDTMLSVMEVFYKGFNDPKYRPAPLLKEMVDAGHLGRKSGRGFYELRQEGSGTRAERARRAKPSVRAETNNNNPSSRFGRPVLLEKRIRFGRAPSQPANTGHPVRQSGIDERPEPWAGMRWTRRSARDATAGRFHDP